jgi:hypothetical protein
MYFGEGKNISQIAGETDYVLVPIFVAVFSAH